MGTLLFHEGDLLAIGTGGVENNRLIFARLDKKSRYIFSAVARYITATFQASWYSGYNMQRKIPSIVD